MKLELWTLPSCTAFQLIENIFSVEVMTHLHNDIADNCHSTEMTLLYADVTTGIMSICVQQMQMKHRAAEATRCSTADDNML